MRPIIHSDKPYRFLKSGNVVKLGSTIVGLLLAVVGGIAPSLVTAAPANAAVSDFRVGIQFIDKAGRAEQGRLQVTPFLTEGGGSSQFAGDVNFFAPDGARLLLSSTGFPTNLDFRICGQAADGRNPRNSQAGAYVCSPWASDGGGATPLVTDDNQFDPDVYRVALEVRQLPDGVQITDLRLFITAFDNGDGGVTGPTHFTPALSQGGGFSPDAFDRNSFDPDGFFFCIAPGRALG
jgi:hypothetical protein